MVIEHFSVAILKRNQQRTSIILGIFGGVVVWGYGAHILQQLKHNMHAKVYAIYKRNRYLLNQLTASKFSLLISEDLHDLPLQTNKINASDKAKYHECPAEKLQ